MGQMQTKEFNGIKQEFRKTQKINDTWNNSSPHFQANHNLHKITNKAPETD